jgi:hypothetical protein
LSYTHDTRALCKEEEQEKTQKQKTKQNKKHAKGVVNTMARRALYWILSAQNEEDGCRLKQPK